MINIELSYRVAKIMDIIMEQGLEDRLSFTKSINAAKSFSDLPEETKLIILNAERYLKTI